MIYSCVDCKRDSSVWYIWVLYFKNIYIFYFTIFYWFCHISTWICHGCTRVPHPESPSRLPLGHPSAPAPSTLYHALNLDWWSVSHMIIHMFQCHSTKASHPRPLPQSPKDCSTYLCLFCCLAYWVIITIMPTSIYMCYGYICCGFVIYSFYYVEVCSFY